MKTIFTSLSAGTVYGPRGPTLLDLYFLPIPSKKTFISSSNTSLVVAYFGEAVCALGD
jgi:hypothetical protein